MSTTLNKGTTLLTFLKETATLRRKRMSSYGRSDKILWFGTIPRGRDECRSPFLTDEPEGLSDLWLEVRKRRKPMRPPVPETVVDWVRAEDLDQYETETEPELRPEMTVLVEQDVHDPDTPSDDEKQPELRRLVDYPEVKEAWLEYLVDKWEPWAKEMRRWQETHRVYEELDFMRRRLEESEERYELHLGVGLLQWRDPTGIAVKRHLLTAPAEITLDAARGLLTVIPAASFDRFQVELDMLELQHQPRLDEAIEDQLDELDVRGWDTSSLAPILRAIASRLRADAEVDEGGIVPADRAEGSPRLSPAPALVLRERLPKAYDSLIHKFLETANNGALEATGPWSHLLREGEAPGGDAGDPGRDVDTPRRGSDRFLFPLPANDEQRQIVHRLQGEPCVLVKGPPGTGKSHTIANLICHLLAKGDRVLVTAQAPKALAVLRDLLPVDVRDLCVTALSSSREDQRLLEESVRGILRRNNEWQGPLYTQHQHIIAQTEKDLQDLEGKIAEGERYLRESREAETHPHTLPGGYQGTAAQIARALDEQREQFNWFPHNHHSEGQFPLNSTEAALLTEVHTLLDGETSGRLRLEIGVANLPEPDQFREQIETLVAAEEAAARVAGTAALGKVGVLGQSPSRALRDLCAALESLESLAAKAARVIGDLTETILEDCLVGRVERWTHLASDTEDLLSSATVLLGQLSGTSVELPADVHPEHLWKDAERRLTHFRKGGRRGFSVFSPRLIKETRYVVEQCRVDGRKPDSVEQLASIVNYLELNLTISELKQLWPTTLPEFPNPRQAISHAQELTAELRSLLHFFSGKGNVAAITSVLLGERASLASAGERQEWLKAANSELATRAAQDARAGIEEILDEIRRCQSGATPHPCLAALAEAAEAGDVHAWAAAWEERERVRTQKKRLDHYRDLLEKLGHSCPGLGELLQANEGNPEWRHKVQGLEQAWNWSSARAWLRRISDVPAYKERVSELHRLQRRVEEATEKLVSLRAWPAFFDRLDSGTVQSLNAWTRAVNRVGKGTGKYAYRHRRTARRYLMDCVPRIPAWIMPLHRLWDTVEAKPGLFDTVIVDEASQASVDSLALLLLAKRIIVVGDDKQNSPEAIGVLEDDVARLAREHLNQFQFRDEFRPDTSLFDHSERAFGNLITLREHFRCVPEIIRFSNELCYRDAPLIPLRQAPPNRLPPMQSRFITKGACQGERQRIYNQAEADALVKVIESLIADDSYEGKSMGVITLQGHAQAELIENLLVQRLDPATIEKRRLHCGGPATFQGDERDVIFLSLVIAPNIRYRALTRLPDQRRFNVAMSRARDQVWLFHSVSQHDLGPGDLRRELIDFFENPERGSLEQLSGNLDYLERQARSRRQRGNQPEPYDSWFEVDVALELLRRKFVVRPQVAVAGRRIDLVVEGADARLAVECDGDEWHGAEQYERDMARQRQLERAGWTFVRVRESDFYADREAATRSITDACADLGIFSLGCIKEFPTPSSTDEESQESSEERAAGSREAEPHGGLATHELARSLSPHTNSQNPTSGIRRPSDFLDHEIRNFMTWVKENPDQLNIEDRLFLSDLEGKLHSNEALGGIELANLWRIYSLLLHAGFEPPDPPASVRSRVSGAPELLQLIRDILNGSSEAMSIKEIQKAALKSSRHIFEIAQIEDCLNRNRGTFHKVDGGYVANIEEEGTSGSLGEDKPAGHQVSRDEKVGPRHPKQVQPQDPVLEQYSPAPQVPYTPFKGQAGPDPRVAGPTRVAEGLCRIIEMEGPIFARRAYEVYLRTCGLGKLGSSLKRSLNKALQYAISSGRVVKEDELERGGLLDTVVRMADTPPIILRERGPRDFAEIPPSEIQLVARLLIEDGNIHVGTEDHLKDILEGFGAKRLTKQRRAYLKDILRRQYSYVDILVLSTTGTRKT